MANRVGEFLKIRLWNGNTRRYVYIPLAILGAIVAFIFNFGRQTQVAVNVVGTVTELRTRVDDHEKKLIKYEAMQEDVKEIKDNLKDLNADVKDLNKFLRENPRNR